MTTKGFTSRVSARAELVPYYALRQSWMLDPRRRNPDEPTNPPILVLGVQGGGSTLVCRMLRRHHDIVSVSGNSSRWAGPDEMHVVMSPALPDSLRLRPRDLSKVDPFGKRVGWAYASDELLGSYRDIDPVEADRVALKKTIGYCLRRWARDESARFIDKSQSYSVKVPLLRELLTPLPINAFGIARDPYAAVWRAATGADLRLVDMPLEQRVRVAASHWTNTYACLQSDGVPIFRFEDVLTDAPSVVESICDSVGLTYSGDLLPKADQNVPWPARERGRWYPMRPSVNERHRSGLEPWVRRVIDDNCADLARSLGYRID